MVPPGDEYPPGVAFGCERIVPCHVCRPKESEEDVKNWTTMWTINKLKTSSRSTDDAKAGKTTKAMHTKAAPPAAPTRSYSERCQSCGRSLGNDVGNFCSRACRAAAYL